MKTDKTIITSNIKPSGQQLNAPRLFFLFWISCFLLPMSCVEESERLTRAERKIADSLVIKQTKILRSTGDSLCEIGFETSVTTIVDSLLVKRLGDIKKILDE